MDQGRDQAADVGSPPSAVNSGVYISGGVISGPIAAGNNAQAVQIAGAGNDKLQRIEELLSYLETLARALLPARADDIADDVGRLRAEVRHRRPAAGSIRPILARLTVAATGAATLLAAVDQIKDLVTQLL
jgi:hypothetical protein